MRAHRRRPLTCQEIVELVTDYLEGALSRGDRRRFEAHLHECDGCAEFLRQMRAIIAMAGTVMVDDLSPAQQQELTTMFREWRSESP